MDRSTYLEIISSSIHLSMRGLFRGCVWKLTSIIVGISVIVGMKWFMLCMIWMIGRLVVSGRRLAIQSSQLAFNMWAWNTCP